MLNDKIAYTDEMLASIFRRPINMIRLALKTFATYGMIEIIDDVITIPNWEKHQSLDSLERKKEYDRQYQANKRLQQKQLIEVKNSNENIEIPIKNRTISYDSRTTVVTLEKEEEREIDIEEEKENPKEKEIVTRTNSSASCGALFDRFWNNYPKKKGKDKCIRWFQSHKVTEELLNQMIQAIENQKNSKEWQKDEGQFIPYPYTWLNQGRWKDELDAPNEPVKNDWIDDWYQNLSNIKYN